MDGDVEVARRALLASADGGSQRDVLLALLAKSHHAALIAQIALVARGPEDGVVLSAHGGQRQTVIQVVSVATNGQVLGLVGQCLIVREQGHHPHLEGHLVAHRRSAEMCCQRGVRHLAADGRARDVARRGDHVFVAALPFNLHHVGIAGGQFDVACQRTHVAQREVLDQVADGRILNLAVQRRYATLQLCNLVVGDGIVAQHQVVHHGILQIGVATIAAATQIRVLELSAQCAGLQAHRILGCLCAIDEHAAYIVLLHIDDVHPASLGQCLAGVHALLAAVVGLGDREARLLGTEEQVAR